MLVVTIFDAAQAVAAGSAYGPRFGFALRDTRVRPHAGYLAGAEQQGSGKQEQATHHVLVETMAGLSTQILVI